MRQPEGLQCRLTEWGEGRLLTGVFRGVIRIKGLVGGHLGESGAASGLLSSGLLSSLPVSPCSPHLKRLFSYPL